MTVEIGIDDSYYFVHCVSLLKCWDSVIPFSFTKNGFSITMKNEKLKSKTSEMLIKLSYPVYNLIDYKINSTDRLLAKVDAVMFDDKTKGIKQADKLIFRTKPGVNALFYDFNSTASSEIKTHQDLVGETDMDFPEFDEFKPVVVINKTKYSIIATDLKRLKKQHIFDASIYSSGIKFTYYSYGVKIPTVSTLGYIAENQEKLFDMNLDAQFLLFAQSKMSKLSPEKSPIKIYALATKGFKTLIIRIPVGCTGYLDVSYSNTD